MRGICVREYKESSAAVGGDDGVIVGLSTSVFTSQSKHDPRGGV